MDRHVFRAMWVLAVAACLSLYAANLFLGEVNQDEGWYLYAGRMVAEGKVPYADFAFTQGPVMADVYACAWPLVRRWGVAGGRLFTVLFGIAGCAACVLLTARLVPRSRCGAAALIAFSFVGVNVYQAYFTTVVKTYALTGFLLASGFLLLSYVNERRGWPAGIAGVCMALAAGTRSSAGVVVALVCGVLVYQRIRTVFLSREAGSALCPRIWLWFGAGAGVTAVLLFLPYAILSPTGLWFGLIEYHIGREAGNWLTVLLHKAGFLSRMASAYFVAIAAGVTAAAWWLLIPRNSRLKEVGREHALEGLLWGSAGLLTLIHIAAPFPYDDYQAIAFPLFAVALATTLTWRCPADLLYVAAMAILLLCVAAAFSSPRNQDWFVQGRDRIWWPLRRQSSLATLRAAGRELRRRSAPGDEVLTQDAYLAVESGLRLPSGLEMGPFSYFPEMSHEDAARRHVLNAAGMRALLTTTEAPLAALSGWSFAVRSPSVTRVPAPERESYMALVESRYTPVAGVEHFGQADTRLRIMDRR